MVCGTASIVSNLPSLQEWITHEENGLFIQTNNISNLSDAILRLINEPQLSKKIGTNASNSIREKADQKNWMEVVNNIYQRYACI
jgi:glycosyltransferase involved in cell wall biosynthesis